jgi:hypothetical protein
MRTKDEQASRTTPRVQQRDERATAEAYLAGGNAALARGDRTAAKALYTFAERLDPAFVSAKVAGILLRESPLRNPSDLEAVKETIEQTSSSNAWEDPDWYRVVHALVGARLNVLSNELNKRLYLPFFGEWSGKERETKLKELEAAANHDVESINAAVNKALVAATELRNAVRNVLADQSAAKQPRTPRRFLTKSRRLKFRAFALHSFVATEVDQASMVLEASTKLIAEQAKNFETASALADAKRPEFADALAANFRLDDSGRLSYRICYNLSCYYARAAVPLVWEADKELARRSLDWLGEARDKAPAYSRGWLVTYAAADPAFVPLLDEHALAFFAKLRAGAEDKAQREEIKNRIIGLGDGQIAESLSKALADV